jgi:iron complex outermembrane receptor protein
VSSADSETITSGEIGFKATVAEDRIRVNGAIYYYQVKDQQFTAIGGATNSVRLVNADTGLGKGFDLDAEMLFTDNFLMTFGLSYNDTEIDDPNLRVATCGSGQCSVTDTLDSNGFAIVDGNQFPQAPDLILNFSLRYTQPVDGGDLFFVTDWARQSDTQFFLYESREFHSGDIYEGGVRAGFTQEEGRWEIAVFGRNITDEENLKGGIDFNNNTGFVNDRRIWGATLKVNFGSL